ncbi:MAG: Acyl carrier protein [Candidatus Ozemobacter sibiricus]|jgi:acyl carrier protein|uniref:Acyl carrier protein n=1 Tax=Candidatus Ozemobacter sibiricus TaxID=2268124 RepID=A0A367ZT94_9BACT|nr:MAG: Acyl carrier protein [Candidatus Ozemobacter sibiricus]
MYEDIFDRVRDAIHESLGVTKDRITLKARLIDDLGSDSLDLLDILFALEEKFGIKIKRGQIEAMARQGIPDAEFEVDGQITERGAARLREVLPEVEPHHIVAGMPLARLPYLFTVETFCRLVQAKLREKEGR